MLDYVLEIFSAMHCTKQLRMMVAEKICVLPPSNEPRLYLKAIVAMAASLIDTFYQRSVSRSCELKM